MTCDHFADLFELYALGSLEEPEAEALRNHLHSGCVPCTSSLNQALAQAASVSSAIPLVTPTASLRERIAASVAATPAVVLIPEKKRPRVSAAPWLLAAASLAALVVGIAYEETSRHTDLATLAASMEERNHANAQRTAAMLSILQAPGTKQVSFDVTKSDLPHGSVFIHKNLGVAMVVAHLPAAPEGWKYESWVVPKSGAPRPVESFATDKSGFAFTVIKGPVDVSQWSAMAVSMEPENSTPLKPTKLVFASPV